MKIDIIRKNFGSEIVLQNLHLELEEGRVYMIQGPSGKGKTTLLRILAGLDRDYEGTISGFEKPTLLFQEDRLLLSIPVLSNLLSVTGDMDKALRFLQDFGLQETERKKTAELSGGMRRRLAIIRMLLASSSSSVLLFDEPFSGLDTETKRLTASILERERKDRTLLFVSHDSEDQQLFDETTLILL